MNIKMKLGFKFAVSFGVILVLMLIMTVNTFINLQNVKKDLQIIDEANTRMILADNIAFQYKNTVAALRGYAAYGDEAYLNQTINNFEELIKAENELLAIAREEKKPEVKKMINDTLQYKDIITKEYLPLVKNYNTFKAADSFAVADEYDHKMQASSKNTEQLALAISDRADKFAAENADIAQNLIDESQIRADRINYVSIIISIIMLILGVTIAVALTNMIRKPVLALTAIAKQYAQGDLSNIADIKVSDEIGELADSLKIMHNNFVRMITNIRSASGQLATASEQMAASTEEVTATGEGISQNMQHLAGEADRGNKSMLEASQALVELSSLIQIARKKANHTSNNSQEALLVAENGRLKVTESVGKMDNITAQTKHSSEIIGELSEYSQQISYIIDTITNIAKQTNLLALNAAIEAARAGEHGRGFAVVAEEVRKLAEQSNQGASEITSLVQKVAEKTQLAVVAMEQNVTEVETGVATVNEAGQALDNILEAMKLMAEETKEIGKLTSEQVANSDQIVQLINSLSTVIETVASHSEEVTAAVEEQSSVMQSVAAGAQETSAMANELRESVEIFKV